MKMSSSSAHHRLCRVLAMFRGEVVRHGESFEDVDHRVHGEQRNEDIPLTQEGRAQAIAFGIAYNRKLRRGKMLKIFISPSARVRETAELIAAQITKRTWEIIEDSLLAKQNTGLLSVENHQEIDAERFQKGIMNYRYPEGESGWDVLGRMNQFVEKIKDERLDTVLIITHGFEYRVLLMAMLGWDREFLESFPKPENCESRKVTRRGKKYRIKGKSKKLSNKERRRGQKKLRELPVAENDNVQEEKKSAA